MPEMRGRGAACLPGPLRSRIPETTAIFNGTVSANIFIFKSSEMEFLSTRTAGGFPILLTPLSPERAITYGVTFASTVAARFTAIQQRRSRSLAHLDSSSETVIRITHLPAKPLH